MIGPLCVITDAASPWSVEDQLRLSARGGARMVQVRDKHARDAEVAALVRHLLPIARALGVTLIVNDRVDVAVATGADGVHIGQGDGDPVAVRARIGAQLILGLSVETVAQAARVPPSVDYIGAGPVRATATKPDHAPAIGWDGLAAIVAASTAPVLAIGGLGGGAAGAEDAARVRGAGAAGLAVVSAVTRAADPATAVRDLLLAWGAA